MIVEQANRLGNGGSGASRIVHAPPRQELILLDRELNEALTRYAQEITSVSFYRKSRLIRRFDTGTNGSVPFFSFDNERFCRALSHAVVRNRCVESMLRTEVVAISPANGLLRIRGARYDQISARHIVVADGSASRIRSALSIPFRIKRYHKTFLVSNPFKTPAGTDCEIHIHSNGTVVLLPIGRDLAQWFVEVDQRIGIAERKMSRRHARRLASQTDTVEREIRYRTGRFKDNGDFDGADLVRIQSAHADSLRVGKAFIVGDAAYRVPAMSGIDFDHLFSDILLVSHSINSGECVDEKRQTLLTDSVTRASRISRWVIGKGWRGLFRASGFVSFSCPVSSSSSGY